MRRTLIVVPELVGEPGTDSPLRQKLPALEMLAEMGSLGKLPQVPPVLTPEALYLGMTEREAQMQQGPLTVSAFGADPPERSTHFHVSLMSLPEREIQAPSVVPTDEELRKILEVAPKLNTKSLTFVIGEELDHALVWEGLGDIETRPESAARGLKLREALPQGDAESMLRRFIDDSVNLLSELELNERRIGEGFAPFNLLWPWGQGTRVAVPNLALRRGEPALVESESLRMAGLVRLTGYRHGDRHWLGHGLNLNLGKLANHALSTDLLIVLISAPATFRGSEMSEEFEWFAKRLDSELIQPLLDDALREPAMISVVAPSASGEGLALWYGCAGGGGNVLPFDERALEEPRLETVDLSTAVLRAIDS